MQRSDSSSLEAAFRAGHTYFECMYVCEKNQGSVEKQVTDGTDSRKRDKLKPPTRELKTFRDSEVGSINLL